MNRYEILNRLTDLIYLIEKEPQDDFKDVTDYQLYHLLIEVLEETDDTPKEISKCKLQLVK